MAGILPDCRLACIASQVAASGWRSTIRYSVPGKASGPTGRDDRQGPSAQFAEIVPQLFGCPAQRTGGFHVDNDRIPEVKRRRIIAAVGFQFGDGPGLLALRDGLQTHLPCNNRIEEQVDVGPAGRLLDVQRGHCGAVGLLIAEDDLEPSGRAALVLARREEQAVNDNFLAEVYDHAVARRQRRAADPGGTEVVVSHFRSQALRGADLAEGPALG